MLSTADHAINRVLSIIEFVRTSHFVVSRHHEKQTGTYWWWCWCRWICLGWRQGRGIDWGLRKRRCHRVTRDLIPLEEMRGFALRLAPPTLKWNHVFYAMYFENGNNNIIPWTYPFCAYWIFCRSNRAGTLYVRGYNYMWIMTINTMVVMAVMSTRCSAAALYKAFLNVVRRYMFSCFAYTRFLEVLGRSLWSWDQWPNRSRDSILFILSW